MDWNVQRQRWDQIPSYTPGELEVQLNLHPDLQIEVIADEPNRDIDRNEKWKIAYDNGVMLKMVKDFEKTLSQTLDQAVNGLLAMADNNQDMFNRSTTAQAHCLNTVSGMALEIKRRLLERFCYKSEKEAFGTEEQKAWEKQIKQDIKELCDMGNAMYRATHVYLKPLKKELESELKIPADATLEQLGKAADDWLERWAKVKEYDGTGHPEAFEQKYDLICDAIALTPRLEIKIRREYDEAVKEAEDAYERILLPRITEARRAAGTDVSKEFGEAFHRSSEQAAGILSGKMSGPINLADEASWWSNVSGGQERESLVSRLSEETERRLPNLQERLSPAEAIKWLNASTPAVGAMQPELHEAYMKRVGQAQATGGVDPTYQPDKSRPGYQQSGKRKTGKHKPKALELAGKGQDGTLGSEPASASEGERPDFEVTVPPTSLEEGSSLGRTFSAISSMLREAMGGINFSYNPESGLSAKTANYEAKISSGVDGIFAIKSRTKINEKYTEEDQAPRPKKPKKTDPIRGERIRGNRPRKYRPRKLNVSPPGSAGEESLKSLKQMTTPTDYTGDVITIEPSSVRPPEVTELPSLHTPTNIGDTVQSDPVAPPTLNYHGVSTGAPPTTVPASIGDETGGGPGDRTLDEGYDGNDENVSEVDFKYDEGYESGFPDNVSDITKVD